MAQNAPASLASAVTMLDKGTRVDRALTRLEEVLDAHRLHRGDRIYQKSAETGFVHLLQNLGNIKVR